MNFDIEKIINKLLIKYPGFSTIIANMKYIPSYDCKSNGKPTAGCDGKNYIYHPDFMPNLTEGKQLFAVAHEVSHIALDHIYRSEGKDHETWNIATDAIINAQLKKAGLEFIEGVVDIEGADKYDAEELYNKLLEEKNNNDQNQKSSTENNFSDEYKDVGHDTHSMWAYAVKNHKEELKNGTENKEITEEQKNNSKLGEKEVFRRNEKLKRENLKKLREDLVEQSSNKSVPSGYIKLNNIGNGSILNWQTLLKNTTKINIDWSYRDATIEDGVVTPHLEMLPTPETEILLDTSGSISEELLKNFLRECKGILNTSNIKVGCFDTRFYGFTEIKREADIDNMVFEGGGSTNFTSAIQAFTKRVDNRIIFTDGKASMPNESLDVIWIVFGDKKINPKGGKVIYIDEEQLSKLNSSVGKTR